jgi:hypothetical protein
VHAPGAEGRGVAPHVEHAVRLVKHQVRHLSQVDLARLEEVVKAPWRRNHNVRTVTQVAQLRALGRAAVHARRVDVGRAPELDRFIVDLRRELARRRQHEDDRALARILARLLDVLEPREEEAKRLARAGLGNADAVATLQGSRPRLRLHDGRQRKAGLLDARHDLRRNRRLLESKKRICVSNAHGP